MRSPSVVDVFTILSSKTGAKEVGGGWKVCWEL